MLDFILLIISSVCTCMLCIHVWYIPAKSLPSALKEHVYTLLTVLYRMTMVLLCIYIAAFAYIVNNSYEQIVSKDMFSVSIISLLFLTLILHLVTLLQIKRNVLHTLTSVLYVFAASASIVYTITLFEASLQKIILMWVVIVAVVLILRYAVSTYRKYI